jgi:uncharacterized protein HemY
VNKLKERCLLKKATFVMENILKILHMCTLIKEHFDTFMDDPNDPKKQELLSNQIEKIGEDYRKTVKMLVTIIKKIIQRGLHPHCM